MIRNECKIVRDLIPNYIEDQISNETKMFVDEHMKECKNCKEILDTISNEKEKVHENKEIDFLKKYNIKMTIFKIIAFMLFMVILIMWTVLIINYMRNKKAYDRASYIYDIMNTTYEKIEEMENNNNYSIITEYVSKTNTNKNTLLYKDNNYKEINVTFNSEVDYINYGVILNNERFFIQCDISESKYYDGYSCSHGRRDKLIYDFYRHENILDYINYDIREEQFEGREYYVIRCNGNETKYSSEFSILIRGKIDLWIDKESMLLCKSICTNDDGDVEYEYNFSWEVDNVTDEDVKIKDYNEYQKLQEFIGKFK